MDEQVSKDSLGDRMKDHEYRTRYFLPMLTYSTKTGELIK